MRATSLQLAAACLLLILLCAAALPFLRADQRSHRLHDRINEYASPHARATVVGSHERAKAAPAASIMRTLALVARLVAFNPAHQEEYPAKWWIVLPVTMLLARLIVEFGQSLFGTSALIALPVRLDLARSTILSLVRTASKSDPLRTVSRRLGNVGACRSCWHPDHRGNP